MNFQKSLDGGATWSKYDLTSAPDADGLAVTVDPANDNVIYVGGRKNSKPILFKSINGGSGWTEITGNVSGTVRDIALDPASPLRVYVETSAGIYRSEDGGMSWSRISARDAKSLIINPAAPNEIYAGGSDGIYFSNNRGDSWIEFNAGLTTRDVLGLAMNPGNKILYAATNGGGVFKNSLLDLYSLIISASAGGTTLPAPGTYLHAANASVSITASPSAYFEFSGWSGDASGTANPLSLIMTGNKSVRADFRRIIYPPQNFAATKKQNRSLLLAQYHIQLTWQNDANNADIVKNRLYLHQDGAWTLLAELAPEAKEYVHKNVEKDREYAYAVAAVNSEGREGPAATVTVK
ncbi:MAG: hypothetical protein NTU60_02815 [Candidatus Aminicenantes bacterium]|nr:hypothetical protein [Candidatus Aminicenantes bacterium]